MKTREIILFYITLKNVCQVLYNLKEMRKLVEKTKEIVSEVQFSSFMRIGQHCPPFLAIQHPF